MPLQSQVCRFKIIPGRQLHTHTRQKKTASFCSKFSMLDRCMYVCARPISSRWILRSDGPTRRHFDGATRLRTGRASVCYGAATPLLLLLPTLRTHTHTRARRKHTSVEFEIFEKRVESRGSDECGKKRKDEEEEEGKKNARVHQCFPPAFLPISTRGAGRSLQVHSPVGLARITCASPPPHHTIL